MKTEKYSVTVFSEYTNGKTFRFIKIVDTKEEVEKLVGRSKGIWDQEQWNRHDENIRYMRVLDGDVYYHYYIKIFEI